MLKLPEDSPETECLIDIVSEHIHRFNDGACILGVQIGVITGPCIADCGFCSFACSTTKADDFIMSQNELESIVEQVTRYDDVSVISLMTIHNIDVDDLLDAVKIVRKKVSNEVEIAINTGDLSLEEFKALKKAGASRAYHSIRLDEGDTTRLNPLDRMMTVRSISQAGLKLIGCIEPIGPEHTPDYIARRYFEAEKEGYTKCSAAKRIAVPGTRLYGNGEISDRRLQQIRSALFLSNRWLYGGFYGGMDHGYAEYAGSPKDNADYSETTMGKTIENIRKEMLQAGYTSIMKPNGHRVTLDDEYLSMTGSDVQSPGS